MDQVAGQSDFTIETPALGAQYVTHLGIKSIAGFIDATYKTTDKLYLTVGGRYSHEKDDGFWTCLSTIACEACPDKFTLGTHRLKGTWNNFSPRFVARYELDDNSSVYASWTRGFKAGLMNVNGFQPAPIEPEKITSYEVGYKVARGATRFEISSFYYDYKNLQVSSYNGTKSVTSNAATSKVYGGEFSAQQRVTDAFTLSGGVAYTHGRYKKYLTAPRNVFILAAGGIDNSPANASGNNMQRSPDWTGNVAADYLMDVAGGQLALNGNVYFSSKVFFDPTNNNVQPSFTLVNVRATWTDASKHFSVSLWGNNILDEKYKTQVLPNGLSAAASWGSPATYGATVAYKY